MIGQSDFCIRHILWILLGHNNILPLLSRNVSRLLPLILKTNVSFAFPFPQNNHYPKTTVCATFDIIHPVGPLLQGLLPLMSHKSIRILWRQDDDAPTQMFRFNSIFHCCREKSSHLFVSDETDDTK